MSRYGCKSNDRSLFDLGMKFAYEGAHAQVPLLVVDDGIEMTGHSQVFAIAATVHSSRNRVIAGLRSACQKLELSLCFYRNWENKVPSTLAPSLNRVFQAHKKSRVRPTFSSQLSLKIFGVHYAALVLANFRIITSSSLRPT
jgi:hypothetical protein